MADNPRQSFIIDNNPTITWQKVSTATSYTVKIIRTDYPNTPILNEILSLGDPRLVEDEGFLKFMYPATAIPLEPLVEYEFTGRTDDGKTASGNFVFLDSIRSRINNLLKKMEDTTVVTDPQVREEFISVVEDILVSAGPPKPWLNGTSCFFINFD